jgi:hypothetical protein
MKTKKIKWLARIPALLILLMGLPFYFGYGNPLPFINPEYTLHDNMWLTIFPIMFAGLALGWKYEKLGGYLVTIPLGIGLIAPLIVETSFPMFMLVPTTVGILYLLIGYKTESNDN